MAYKNMKMHIYTAEDEEPKCGRCDNTIADNDFCVNTCGTEHGWAGYIRVEIEGKEKKYERTE